MRKIIFGNQQVHFKYQNPTRTLQVLDVESMNFSRSVEVQEKNDRHFSLRVI